MYKAYGLVSGKVYVTGSRADCMRKLLEKYPSTKLRGNKYKAHAQADKLLPETIKMEKI